MSVSSTPLRRTRERSELESSFLLAGLYVLAAYNFALAVFMAAFPHTFYESVGPFGVANDHYIRDTATFAAAMGVGLVIALRRESWRAPMLVISAVQFGLHSINHLLDIGKAHPRYVGYFDFFSLAASTLLIAWLARLAMARETAPPRKGAPA
jgi:hypothetical protein